MRQSLWFFLAAAILAPVRLSADDLIPADRRTDWSGAGARFALPADAAQLNFLEVHPEARSDDDIGPELNALVRGLSEATIIHLPAGTYRVVTPIVFRREDHDHPVFLRGEGWEATRLEFHPEEREVEQSLFEVRGIAHTHAPSAVLGPALKGAKRLQLDDASGFQAGDTVHLRQDNDFAAIRTYKTQAQPRLEDSLRTWAARATGDTVEVSAVEDNTLILARALHTTLDWGGLTATRLAPRTQVGFGSFTAANTRDIDGIYTFTFEFAAHCLIEDIRSVRPVKFHVQAMSSHHLTIADSFFDDAFRHGGGGHGYGVALEWATSDCLTINNLFRRLRHSMMLAKGVVGNVYAYNYSFDNQQDGARVAKDISGHGHYPAMNLCEGNIVQFIHGADFWGSLGPGNTYYRNRATTGGIYLDVYSPQQNAIANEVTASPSLRERLIEDPGRVSLVNHVLVHESVRDPLIFANVAPSDPAPVDYPPLPPSLFLDAPPAFWSPGLPWPALGPPHAPGEHPLPAVQRWERLRHRYP
ncbi:MAG: hypothetical protein ACOC3I_01630 [Verrucomicrobiota bacterium]